jgi:pentatricopeptide repeat protein
MMIEGDPGIVRQLSLNGFFRDANLPKSELIGLLDGLEKKERATGLSGYWDRFAPEEFVRLNMSEYEVRSPEEKAALRQTLEAMISRAFDQNHPETSKLIRQDLLNLAADQIGRGIFAYGDMGKILQQDPSKDGFAYYEALQRVDPEYRKNQDTLKGTDSQVVRAMVTQDPQRTMDMTLIEGSWVKGKGYVALEKWVTMDYRAAEEWYQRNEGKADRDSSAVAFMRACGTLGRFEEALQWYARIESESWKNGIGGEMRSIARKLEAESTR